MEKTKYLDLLAQHGIDNAHPGGFTLTKMLLRNEKITSDMVLLDAGCGTGQTSAYIAEHYPCRVEAIDINPKMLEKARRRFVQSHLNIPLSQADVTHLPFPNNSFDIVLSESVTAFTEIPRTLREYRRVLKPDGLLLIIEATALFPFTENEITDIQTVLGLTNVPTKEEWRQMLQETGFPGVQVLTQQRMWRFPSLSPKINNNFHDYQSLKFRYRRKMGFGVYRCKL